LVPEFIDFYHILIEECEVFPVQLEPCLFSFGLRI